MIEVRKYNLRTVLGKTKAELFQGNSLFKTVNYFTRKLRIIDKMFPLTYHLKSLYYFDQIVYCPWISREGTNCDFSWMLTLFSINLFGTNFWANFQIYAFFMGKQSRKLLLFSYILCINLIGFDSFPSRSISTL